MLKRTLLLLLCAVGLNGFGQSLAGLNYRFMYDPQNEIQFPIKLVNDRSELKVFYKIITIGAQDSPKDYTITWERRESYIQREGTLINAQDSSKTSGQLSFPLPDKPWLLVARIVNTTLNKRWTYFQIMDAKYPVDGYFENENGVVFDPFIRQYQPVTFHGAPGETSIHVFYYKTDFPAALPPFADKEPKPDRFLFVDSSFNIRSGEKFSFTGPGLYLLQQDTSAARGVSISVVRPSFPKFTRAEDIPDPLVFVSTKEEHDELVAAGSSKPKIDKVILDITGSKDRAKNFMKSYFKRIELTNLFFTSYKEGWKTDRGMILLVFGLPDEVSRTGANEIWIYKNIKERFTFLKSGSVYDPQYYTLMRNSKFAQTWYSTIDLWRKSQF